MYVGGGGGGGGGGVRMFNFSQVTAILIPADEGL